MVSQELFLRGALHNLVGPCDSRLLPKDGRLLTSMNGRTHTSFLGLLLVMLGAAHVGFAAGPADDQFAVAAQHYSRQRWELAAAEFQTFVESHPQDGRVPEAYFYWGESLAQLRRDAAAIERLEQFIKLAPEHPMVPRAHFRIGELAHLTGRREASLQHLARFLELTRSDSLKPRAMLYTAESERRAGNMAAAHANYQHLVQKFPQTFEAHAARIGLAELAVSQHQFPTAIGLLQFVSQQGPQSLRQIARAKLARCQFESGSIESARASWERILAEPAAAAYHDEATLGVAECQAALGDWKGVRHSLEKLSSAAVHQWGAVATGLKALSALHSDDLDGFRRYLDELLAQWPRSEWSERVLRQAVTWTHQHRQAEETIEFADLFDEFHPRSQFRDEVHRRRIRALARLKRWSTIIELATDSTDDRLAKAAAELALEQYTAALGTVEPLLQRGSGLSEDARRVAQAIQGMALVGVQQYAKGIAALRPFVQDVPTGVDGGRLRAALCTAYVSEQAWDAAESLLADWEATSEERGEVWERAAWELAVQLAENQQRERAATWYRKLLTSHNDETRAAALAGLAWSSFRSNAAAESAEYFAELLQKYPDHPAAPQAALARGQALRQQHRPREALAMFALVLDRFEKSSVAAQALLAAAQTHRELGEADESRKALDRLIEDYGDSQFAAAAWYELGWLEQQRNNPDAALEAFSKVHEAFPESSVWGDATYRLARLLVQQNRFKDARMHLVMLTRDRSRAGSVWAFGWFLRGQLDGQQGDWSSCRQAMQQVLEDSPQTDLSLAAAYWHAEATYRLGEWSEAKEEFDRLINEQKNGETPSWWPRVWLRRAQILAHEEQWNEALEAVQEISRRFPDYEEPQEIYYLVGRCQLGRGKFAAARAAWEKAIDQSRPARSETAAMAQWMIGESYFLQRDYDVAIRAYLRVEALYPYAEWKAAALLQAGKCFEMKGQWQQAIGSYRQLLDTLPETSYRDEAEQRLRVATQRAADPLSVRSERRKR